MPERSPSSLLSENPDFRGAARRTLQQAATMIGEAATTKFMRAGGTDAGPNEQRGIGALRRASGRLARSLIGARQNRGAEEGVFDLTPLDGGVRLTYGTEVPYAAIHEFGSGGPTSVQFVSQHTRTIDQAFGEPLPEGEKTITVRAHSRVMTMPERPYLRPALRDQIDEVTQVAEDEIIGELFDTDPR